jgi:hypothetical protein
MQELEHMLRKLTITTALALALLGFASCGGKAKGPENPDVVPPPPEDPCATPGTPDAPDAPDAPDDPSATAAATEPCPAPQDPDVCNSGPDKRCPDHQQQ